MLVLEFRVRARVIGSTLGPGLETRGYETPGYVKVMIRKVWKPAFILQSEDELILFIFISH